MEKTEKQDQKDDSRIIPEDVAKVGAVDVEAQRSALDYWKSQMIDLQNMIDAREDLTINGLTMKDLKAKVKEAQESLDNAERISKKDTGTK